MEQQNPNCLSAHLRSQFSFYGFLGDQSHGPSGATFGRLAADHSNDALFLVVIEHFSRSGPRLLIQRSLQTVLLITVTKFSDGLRCQRDPTSNLRSRESFGQLQQSGCAQDDSHLLNPAFEELMQFFLVSRAYSDTQGGCGHVLSILQNISLWNCSKESGEAVWELA